MELAFTEDQLMLRDTVRELFRREGSADQLRAVWNGDATRFDRVWSTLGDMGVLTMCAGKNAGGMGMTELDLVLLLEEAGRAALPDPLVETAAVAVPLLAAAEGATAARWLDVLGGGKAMAAVAFPGQQHIVFGADADLILAWHEDELHAVAGDAVAATPVQSVDRARPLATVSWQPGADTLLARGVAVYDARTRAHQRGALGAAAQLCGLTQHMLDMTVDYVKNRHQFGRPIGSFQALKHKLADTFINLEFARPVVYRAAYALAENDPDAALFVSAAKARASDAALSGAKACLQCHGAMGYSFEYDLHMWMKRAWTLAAAWGDARWHRRQVGNNLFAKRGS